ncbi:DegV domain-containing protein [Ornithinimicrobium tianjinense]|uniref:DegV domain-containing protein n=1 Tax=Ornithinimicrobium tianjinense TaxID=1195761 RepID=A0A917BIJ7_9MICO|nr:DegV domain-containing protein [Ornithinimicrobium tianjinense]
MTVVPLHVSVGGRGSVPAREITPSEVADLLLQGRERLSTSRPSPGEFAEAYREAARAGASGVVSVHLSSRVSGTVEAAELARDQLAGELAVEVVDSGVLGMALGYAVRAASSVAAGGGSAREVADAALRRAAESRTWFCVDTLDHLRRGGRIGLAQALVGSALAIKPILTVRDGEVHPLERVRTRAKAHQRLVDLAVEAVEGARAEGREVEVAVQQLGAQEAAERISGELRERTGLVPELTELDPVISVHVGPGTVGVTVAPV